MRISSLPSLPRLKGAARTAAALLLGTAVLTAQDALIKQAGINGTTKAPETVRTALNMQKGLAVTADGRWWSPVYWNDGSYTTGASFSVFDKARHLLLMVSNDGGASWSKAAEVRTTGAVYGSIFPDRDGHTLHLTWYAMNGKGKISSGKIFGYYSIFYSTYDTRTGKWAGTKDEEVVPAWDANHRWGTPDIAVADNGVVGITFGCGRGVPKGWVGSTRSWAGGLVWKKNGKWSAPHQVNKDYTGVKLNIMALGNTFHMVYRTMTGGYGICYRKFDTTTDKFSPVYPIVPDPMNPSKNIRTLHANNVPVLGVLPGGDVYILYGTGTSHLGGGKLWYVISKGATGKFTKPMQIDDDPKMGWGNNTYYSYTLARNGNAFSVVYSKVAEQRKNLYMRALTPAGPIPPYGKPAIPLRKGKGVDQFRLLSGFRLPGYHAGMRLTYSDLHPIGPLTGGRAMFLGTPTGVAFPKGPGCSGSLSKAPALGAGGIPALNSTLVLNFSDHPASTSGILVLGRNDANFMGIPLPFDLGVLGMTGCSLYQDIKLSLNYTTNAQGTGSLQLPVPNVPSMAGVPLFWQGVVIAPGANTPGLLLTNGIGTIFM